MENTCSFNSLYENGLNRLGSTGFCFPDNDKESIMVKKNIKLYFLLVQESSVVHTLKGKQGLRFFRQII